MHERAVVSVDIGFVSPFERIREISDEACTIKGAIWAVFLCALNGKPVRASVEQKIKSLLKDLAAHFKT